MLGGTTFYFVTDGIESALDQAVRAAGGRDVRLGGGAATIRAYLRAGLVDSLEIAMVPILLAQGERLFDDLGAATARYRTVKLVSSAAVTHVQLDRV